MRRHCGQTGRALCSTMLTFSDLNCVCALRDYVTIVVSMDTWVASPSHSTYIPYLLTNFLKNQGDIIALAVSTRAAASRSSSPPTSSLSSFSSPRHLLRHYICHRCVACCAVSSKRGERRRRRRKGLCAPPAFCALRAIASTKHTAPVALFEYIRALR